METLTLRAIRATEREMENLEKLGLIKRLLPPIDLLDVQEGQAGVRDIYSADIAHGGHKLLFVNLNLLQSELNYHPDKEDIILINPYGPTKSLIWVFGLITARALTNKIESKTLSSSDFIALDIPFNNPRLSFFTVNEGAAHFEVTLPGPGRSPCFWVTEPKDLPMTTFDLSNYSFKVEA